MYWLRLRIACWGTRTWLRKSGNSSCCWLVYAPSRVGNCAGSPGSWSGNKRAKILAMCQSSRWCRRVFPRIRLRFYIGCTAGFQQFDCTIFGWFRLSLLAIGTASFQETDRSCLILRRMQPVILTRSCSTAATACPRMVYDRRKWLVWWGCLFFCFE